MTIKICVGGPITNAISKNGNFNISLKNTIEVISNSLEEYSFEIFSAHREEGYGDLDVSKIYCEIALRDYNWIRLCDVYISVFFPSQVGKNLIKSDGTCVELGWAMAMRKPIIIIKPTGIKLSPLLAGANAITNVVIIDLEEVLNSPHKISEAVSKLIA